MSIRIGNTSEYILLKDFVEEGNDRGPKSKTLEFLQGIIELKISGISSNIRAYFRLDELRQLEADLIETNKNLNRGFKFGNFEDNIALTIVPTVNGHFEITGYLRNSDYSAQVDLRIDTDQSYLREMIAEVKEAIKELMEN